MDENSIFKPIENVRREEVAKPPEAPIGNPVAPPLPPSLPSEPAPSMFFKIIKILLGIIIVSGIILFVYNVILPKFFPSKVNQVKLTYWGLQEEAVTMAPIIADFEKEYPNIKVEYSKQDIEQYKDRLTIRSNNGNGPDVFQFHNLWMPELVNLLLPLPETVISKEDFSKDYYSVARTDLIKNNVIYGIPLQVDTLNLYVNRGLFQAAGLNAPTSWIEFVNLASQLTVKDENDNIKTAGTAMGTIINITHAPDIISMLFVQNGVNLANISSNLPAAADALNFYTSFAKPPNNVWDEASDESIKAFALGALAMYFGYSSDFFTIKSINPNLAFDIYPVPALPGRNITIASYYVEGVSAKSRRQKEALLFLKFLAQKETVRKLFAEASKTRNFGQPFGRVNLADSLKDSVIYPFVAAAPNAVSGLNSQMNSYLNTAVDAILKGESSQSAAENLSAGVSQVLK